MVILEFTWGFTQGRNHISTANGSRHFLWRTVFMNTLRCTLVRSYINALCAMKLITLIVPISFSCEHILKISHIIVVNVTRHFHQMVTIQFIWRYTQERNNIIAANVTRHFLWKDTLMNTWRCTLVRSHTNTPWAIKLNPGIVPLPFIWDHILGINNISAV